MEKIEKSSGNVFADLGFADAEERSFKAFLAMRINSIISRRHVNQTEAGKILGIPQSKVSQLRNGKLDVFSVEKLLYLLLRLDRNIDIRISKNTSKSAAPRISIESDNDRVFVAV